MSIRSLSLGDGLPRAADALWALVSCFAGEHRRRRLMLMLQAYVDDSSNSSPIYTMAGFLGRAEKWAEFSERWAECLGLDPPVAFLKMKEAMACQGQFRGWSNERRDGRLGELVRIARESVICAFSSIVRRDERDDILGRSPETKKFTPYYLTYYGVIMSLLNKMDQLDLNETVDFIFDEQGKESDRIVEAWHDILGMIPEDRRMILAQRPIHRDDKTTLPLQAADMFAWYVNRCISSGAFGVPEKMIPNWSVMEDLSYVHYNWHVPELIQLRAKIAQRLGQTLSVSISLKLR